MEKRRKELAFLAVGVLLLGAALYTTFKPRAKPASAEQPRQVAQEANAQPQEPAEVSGPSVEQEEAGAKKATGSLTAVAKPRRDPFRGRSACVVASVPSSSGSAARPTKISRVPTLPMPPLPSLLGPGGYGESQQFGTLSFPGFASAGMMQPGGTSPGTMAASQATGLSDNVLRVTGIIEGDPTIAILRKGDARYIVRVGDPVQGYVVESISGRRVVLAAGGERRSLFLGGRL